MGLAFALRPLGLGWAETADDNTARTGLNVIRRTVSSVSTRCTM